MRYLFRLCAFPFASGCEASSFAKDEVLALAKAKPLVAKGQILVVDSDFDVTRLAFAKISCEYVGKCKLKDIGSFIPSGRLGSHKYKSFCVRVQDLDGKKKSKDLEREIGEMISGTVNLKSPKTVIRGFIKNDDIYFGIQIHEFREKALFCRDVNARPCFNPSSLQPRLARLLINLSGTREGTILDPFCGVGGILLEAASIGLKAEGIEIDEKWADGAKENIWFYKYENLASVDNADFLNWKSDKKYGAIVTDLPYGKSTGLFGKTLDGLYSAAFKHMRRFSTKAVIMANGDVSAMLEASGWHVSLTHKIHVHKSLTRFIHVCELRPASARK